MANVNVNPVQSACKISTRISIRWLPDPPQETTDTIVMSVKDWYIDLRIEKATGKIDWALAGQRIVETQEPLRVSFSHELDSHNVFASTDCGTFVTLSNGDDLETGVMPRPDIPGKPETEYEEIWRDLPFKEGPGGPQRGLSWILESDEELTGEDQTISTKTFIGRIWGTYLALQQVQIRMRQKYAARDLVLTKSGGDVSARREEWDAEWKEKYAIGESADRLPSMLAGLEGEGQGSWRIPGQKVFIQGKAFIVRAFEDILDTRPGNGTDGAF